MLQQYLKSWSSIINVQKYCPEPYKNSEHSQKANSEFQSQTDFVRTHTHTYTHITHTLWLNWTDHMHPHHHHHMARKNIYTIELDSPTLSATWNRQRANTCTFKSPPKHKCPHLNLHFYRWSTELQILSPFN